MRNKILFALLIIVVAVLSFDFGRSWELSKTAEYCSSIGKNYLMLVLHIVSASEFYDENGGGPPFSDI